MSRQSNSIRARINPLQSPRSIRLDAASKLHSTHTHSSAHLLQLVVVLTIIGVLVHGGTSALGQTLSSSSSSTGASGSGSAAPSSSSSSSSSTGSDEAPPIIPGGVVGGGGSNFGSTDAVFLTTVWDVWVVIILWTLVFTSFAFVGGSILALRVHKDYVTKTEEANASASMGHTSNGPTTSVSGGSSSSVPTPSHRASYWQCKYVPIWIGLPFTMMIVGAGVGFAHGAISAVLIAAASISIPYPVGIDIAAGLGIGQAIVIIYFHLGRADFIHR